MEGGGDVSGVSCFLVGGGFGGVFFFGGGLFHLLLTDYKTLFLIYQLLGHLDEDILFYF